MIFFYATLFSLAKWDFWSRVLVLFVITNNCRVWENDRILGLIRSALHGLWWLWNIFICLPISSAKKFVSNIYTYETNCRYEAAEECTDDDDAKVGISELRRNITDELKMHDAVLEVRYESFPLSSSFSLSILWLRWPCTHVQKFPIGSLQYFSS